MVDFPLGKIPNNQQQVREASPISQLPFAKRMHGRRHSAGWPRLPLPGGGTASAGAAGADSLFSSVIWPNPCEMLDIFYI